MADRVLHCLYCENDIPEPHLTNHLHEHFDYYPHQCKKCDFKSIYPHEMVKHRYDTGHKARKNASRNRYREYLIQKVIEDIYKSARVGTEQAPWNMSEEDSEAESIAPIPAKTSRTDPNSQSTQVRTVSHPPELPEIPQTRHVPSEKPLVKTITRQEVQEDGVSSSNQPVSRPQEHDRQPERDVPVATSSETQEPTKTKARKEVLASLPRLIENIMEQVTNGKKTVKCIRCKEEVSNDYRTKEKHVTYQHQNLSIDVCFPGSVASNEFECGICGKEYHSESGRINHVAESHTELFLKCPLCGVETRTVPKMSKHFEKDHDTHEKRLPKKLFEQWNQQKDEYYDKINVLTRKVFPVKIKAAKSSESSALQDIRASMTSTLATRVFSPPNRLPADHPDCPFQEDEQNSSSRKEKPSPAKAATRQSPRTHVSATTQAKERPKTPTKIAISRQRKTFSSSSSSSETDSDDSTPGQMPINRAPMAVGKPGMSREQIRKRIEYIKERTIEAPPPDSSSVELSSDSEPDERPSTSTTSVQALLKRPIKTEPKSSSESETDQDPSPESSSIPGIMCSTTGEIKTETGAITEAEADAENSDDEPDVKMEPEVQEPDDVDPVALSGVTDQQVYDHFGVKNKEELYSLPQFRPKNDVKENFEKFRGICFKYLRRTMLALQPKVFNVYELYHVRGLAKAGVFHALYGLAPLWRKRDQKCCNVMFKKTSNFILHLFSPSHIIQFCTQTKEEPQEFIEYFEKFETTTEVFNLLFLPYKIDRLFQHYQVKSEEELYSLPQFGRNRFFKPKIFDQIRGKLMRGYPKMMLEVPAEKFSIEVLVYFSQIDVQTAHKIPGLHHIFWVSKTTSCQACYDFTYANWFVYMKHLLSVTHLRSAFDKGIPEPQEIYQLFMEFDPRFMDDHPPSTFVKPLIETSSSRKSNHACTPKSDGGAGRRALISTLRDVRKRRNSHLNNTPRGTKRPRTQGSIRRKSR